MQLSDILFRLGIYRIYQCHDYVFTTVTLACQDPELLQALSRRLYPAAAVQCQCTPIAVSRGIRNAVSRAWRLNPSLFSVIAGHPVLTPPHPQGIPLHGLQLSVGPGNPGFGSYHQRPVTFP